MITSIFSIDKPIGILALILCLNATAVAQVEGDVTDDKNKGIPMALITAMDLNGKIIDSTRSDARGFYFLRGLAPGKYKIEGKAPGFLPSVKNGEIMKMPAEANEGDDTYYALTLDFMLTRLKPAK